MVRWLLLRLVLRSWDGRAGFGALEVEFGVVLGMKLPPGFRGDALSITEESVAAVDPGVDGLPGRLFLLADGIVQGALRALHVRARLPLRARRRVGDGNGAARPVGSLSVERVERRGVSERGVIVGLG
ncbi:hypothetical protein ACVWXB_002046 [Streptomyces sp. TE12347]